MACLLLFGHGIISPLNCTLARLADIWVFFDGELANASQSEWYSSFCIMLKGLKPKKKGCVIFIYPKGHVIGDMYIYTYEKKKG